jgi:hypothetical protein
MVIDFEIQFVLLLSDLAAHTQSTASIRWEVKHYLSKQILAIDSVSSRCFLLDDIAIKKLFRFYAVGRIISFINNLFISIHQILPSFLHPLRSLLIILWYEFLSLSAAAAAAFHPPLCIYRFYHPEKRASE